MKPADIEALGYRITGKIAVCKERDYIIDDVRRDNRAGVVILAGYLDADRTPIRVYLYPAQIREIRD